MNPRPSLNTYHELKLAKAEIDFFLGLSTELNKQILSNNELQSFIQFYQDHQEALAQLLTDYHLLLGEFAKSTLYSTRKIADLFNSLTFDEPFVKNTAEEVKTIRMSVKDKFHSFISIITSSLSDKLVSELNNQENALKKTMNNALACAHESKSLLKRISQQETSQDVLGKITGQLNIIANTHSTLTEHKNKLGKMLAANITLKKSVPSKIEAILEQFKKGYQVLLAQIENKLINENKTQNKLTDHIIEYFLEANLLIKQVTESYDNLLLSNSSLIDKKRIDTLHAFFKEITHPINQSYLIPRFSAQNSISSILGLLEKNSFFSTLKLPEQNTEQNTSSAPSSDNLRKTCP